MRGNFLVIAAIVSCISDRGTAAPTTTDDAFDAGALATFAAGDWTATASFFGTNYTYGPEYQCRLRTSGATLWQMRPNEFGYLLSRWDLLAEERRNADRFAIRWISVRGKRFEVAALQWRLMKPNDSGINLMFDQQLLSVRKRPSDPWMPLTYLTVEMLDARSFEIGYSSELDHQTTAGRRRISLVGFREAAKWCGRQLLRDRLDEERVQELVR